MNNDEPLIVAFPLYPHCTLVDFAGATQIFASSHSGFKPIWLAKTESAVETSDGVSVMPNHSFDGYSGKIDVLFVPGGAFQGVANAMQDEVFLNFIRKTASPNTWTGSVCTGAFILAAAGILRDCEATTYWAAIPILSMLAPKLNLRIPEGYPRGLTHERSKPFTGGGISSSLDLALDIIIKLKGREYARKAQLFAQYQPDPPIKSGDPDYAPAAIVEELTREAQKAQDPLVRAVNELLANPYL